MWREKRAEIRDQNEQVRSAFSRVDPAVGAPQALDDAPIRGALEALRQRFDARYGGFGQAPKFPRPTDVELCLRAFALRGDGRRSKWPSER
jgi:uncharacterized protein YyaL (SSP411 family)